MTDSMRKRKKAYIDKAMELLDCTHFCAYGTDSIVDICNELGIEVPVGKEVHFRYQPYGWRVGDNDTMNLMLRVDYKDTYYHNLADAMIDEAFFHYAKLVPLELMEISIKSEANDRFRNLSADISRIGKEYDLDRF